MTQFITFQQFTVREEALQLADLLKEKNIDLKLETGLEDYNPAFVSDGACRILIRPEDLDKVTGLFIADVSEDYYLFSFTDDELLEIIAKRDEWSHLDFILAQQILEERGFQIEKKQIEKIEELRIAELSQPDNVHPLWIILGYLSALAGGFIGIIFGWSILSAKKRLPSGEKLYNYSENDRKHAQRILIIGSVILPLGLMLRVWGNIALLNQ